MTIQPDKPRSPPPFAAPRSHRRPSSRPVPPRGRMRPRRWFQRLPLLGLIALGLAVLAVGGVMLFRSQAGEARRAPVPIRAQALAGPAPAAMQEMLDTTLAPDEIRAITPDEARAFNTALPFSTLPILAAKPFIMPADRLEDYARAVDCLTAAVYYEAASETAAGQAAVAQVVINRMRHPAYPKTICGVVFQGSERKTGCQFSFTCDGAMGRKPSVEGWARARLAATAALNGYVAAGVGMATHYHTDWVAPYWAERLVKMRQIGTHIFYRWGGGWGLPPAFTGRHADVEPTVDKMLLVATPLDGLALDDPALLPELPPLPTPPVALPALDDRAPAPPPAPRPIVVAAPPPVAAAPPPAEVAAPVVVNPLATRPGEAPPRRRSRIATPS